MSFNNHLVLLEFVTDYSFFFNLKLEHYCVCPHHYVSIVYNPAFAYLVLGGGRVCGCSKGSGDQTGRDR